MSNTQAVETCKDSCIKLVETTIDYGRWFILAALIVALASAGLTIWERLKAPPSADRALRFAARPDGTVIAPVLQALTGLIDALAKAPAWFAMFLAGFALLWLGASTASPQAEKPAPTTTPTPSPASHAAATPTPTPTPTPGNSG